jgi:hypothetical protein
MHSICKLLCQLSDGFAGISRWNTIPEKPARPAAQNRRNRPYPQDFLALDNFFDRKIKMPIGCIYLPTLR